VKVLTISPVLDFNGCIPILYNVMICVYTEKTMLYTKDANCAGI